MIIMMPLSYVPQGHLFRGIDQYLDLSVYYQKKGHPLSFEKGRL